MERTGAVQRIEIQTGHTPCLKPRIHPRIRSLMQEKSLLFDLMERYGSPLNLVFPQNIHDNIRDFQEAYRKNHLRGRIYFSSKPCKSLSLFKEASNAEIGIDVSSAGSLKAVMDCGWQAGRIGATGPKNREYISAALKNDALINVDNIDELKQIVALRNSLCLSHKARITIRLANYNSNRVKFTSQDDTTFGIRGEDMDWVFTYLLDNRDSLSFQGISFHASMASDEQRIAAMEAQLNLTFESIKRGLSPIQINIGGGFPIMYADSCQEWDGYVTALKKSIIGQIESQTWNSNGLGYRLENGVLRGGAMYINHAPVHTKGEELDRWLSFRLPSFGNAAFADIVRDSLLNLCIEPGRGMLDQCGITLGRVAYTKVSGNGENLVGLEMNRSNLHSNHFKQLTEPLVIPYGAGVPNIDRLGFYYIGNLCLSYDMLQYNKTYPDCIPQTNDIVAFMNTAGYMMDFTESETLMQPVAQKIAMVERDGRWDAVRDQEYRSAI